MFPYRDNHGKKTYHLGYKVPSPISFATCALLYFGTQGHQNAVILGIIANSYTKHAHRATIAKIRGERQGTVIMPTQANTAICLDVDHLSVAFPDQQHFKPVVEGIGFQLRQGQTLALVGESGAGKSMIAQAIIQCLPHHARLGIQSKITLQGQALLSLSEADMCHIRGQKIGMIFQDALTALNPVVAIGQQIDENMRQLGQYNRRERKQKALQLLQEVGIQDPERVIIAIPTNCQAACYNGL